MEESTTCQLDGAKIHCINVFIRFGLICYVGAMIATNSRAVEEKAISVARYATDGSIFLIFMQISRIFPDIVNGLATANVY